MERGVTWTPPPQRSRADPWPFVGIGGLACCLFIVLGSVQILPWWMTTLLVLAWMVAFVLAVRWWTPHPRRVALLPVTVLALWLAGVVVAAS